jgi:alpha-tubulin suppressor-like RCC1 family protein
MRSRRPYIWLAAGLYALSAACSDDTVGPQSVRIAFVTIFPVATTLAPGDTLTLAAIGRDSIGLPVGPRAVVWMSSEPAVVLIDSAGLARAIAPGSATISAMIDGTEGNASIRVAASTPAYRFIAVSAGGHHTCAIGSPPVVLCWGRNKDGQVGNGTFSTSAQPAAVGFESAVIDVVTGARHSCALAETGTVSCWGWNANGQLGAHVGEDKRLTRPTSIDAAGPFVKLAAGSAHNCALAANGGATCWGSDEIGQLGDGTDDGNGVPAAAPFADITTGHAHTCAVTNAGAVWCWGWNAYGQLGPGIAITQCAQNVPCSVLPQRVEGLPAMKTVRAGFGFTCALSHDGRTYCWGLGIEGQLGSGTRVSSDTPVALSADHRFITIEAGAAHACGITDAGEVWCWGANRNGQLGDGSRANRSSPTRVTMIERPVDHLSAGESHTCAILDDTRLACWGSAGDGRLGPYAR